MNLHSLPGSLCNRHCPRKKCSFHLSLSLSLHISFFTLDSLDERPSTSDAHSQVKSCFPTNTISISPLFLYAVCSFIRTGTNIRIERKKKCVRTLYVKRAKYSRGKEEQQSVKSLGSKSKFWFWSSAKPVLFQIMELNHSLDCILFKVISFISRRKRWRKKKDILLPRHQNESVKNCCWVKIKFRGKTNFAI